VFSWDVLKSGVDKSTSLDLLLATHTRSLERRAGLSPLDKSTQFFQYAIMNKLLSNFCASLVKNAEVISKYYQPGCIMSSAEHSTMFVLQLSTLESLNFWSLWGSQDGVRGNMSGSEEGPQKTAVLQSAASLSPSSTSTKLAHSQSQESMPKQEPRQPEMRSSTSTLFGGPFDAQAPLTFSLKPRSAPSPSFSHAFVPMTSPTPPSHIEASTPTPSASPISAAVIASSPSPQPRPMKDISFSTTIQDSVTIQEEKALSHVPSPVPAPLRSSSNDIVRSKSESAPLAQAPHELTSIAAEVEAPILETSSSPLSSSSSSVATLGSAKKRPKKRTIDL